MKELILAAAILIALAITTMFVVYIFIFPKAIIEAVAVDDMAPVAAYGMTSNKAWSVSYMELEGESSRLYRVSQYVFVNASTMDDFGDALLSGISVYSESSVQVGNVEGRALDVLEASGATSYCILLKRGNTLLFSEGRNKEELLKVTEWFLKRH